VNQVRALQAHQIPQRPPLQLSAGDKVHAGDRDTEWPEFVFVSAANGSGWVPARHLSKPHGDAVVQTPYDTTELPTEVADVLEVIIEDTISGWLWCRAGNGREGWVPLNSVEGCSP
jgi:hypothetical protein